MTRAFTKSLRDMEQILAAEFREDGFQVIEQDGVWFARIGLTAESGEFALSEVNISRIAACIERRLS